MKRGGPLKRTDSLKRTGPIRLRGVRAARYADKVAEWQTMRLAVYSRDHGRCVACGEYVHADRFECHHRKLRSRGGLDTHSNLVTLCPAHHGDVHRNPAWATAVGLMVPGAADPIEWPVLRRLPLRVVGGTGLWAVPDDLTGEWIVTAPDPDQHDEPAPWEAIA